jgi:hypothetical protein
MFARHFAWLKYLTYHLLLVSVLAPNCKQHILSPAKIRKVCYSKMDFMSNLFTRIYSGLSEGVKFMKHFKGSVKFMKHFKWGEGGAIYTVWKSLV